MKSSILLELEEYNNDFEFDYKITDAIYQASEELLDLEESISSLNLLKSTCDKLDYTLAISSGALCGIVDIFLIGKPGESPIGNITDDWFENRINDFAKMLGWKNKESKTSNLAISYLEEKFKVPYDQRGAGDSGKVIYNLTPTNHHFKSLAHNPNLLGLFFSILDQFTNQSHFISEGKLIALQQADDRFELQGKNIVSKLFSAFVNWFGHLMSDISGASGSKTRGMGIPSPILSWSNSIIAIKEILNISPTEFDKSVNELSVRLFNKGYDIRFQTAQVIPVIINELITRFIYMVRRVIKYFFEDSREKYSFKELWKSCEPFSNASVKRMLTTAHGAFCLIDVGDAALRGTKTSASFNVMEFIMRINLIGIGRFTVSLYGEITRGVDNKKNKRIIYNMNREKQIVNYYIEGLRMLQNEYNDTYLVNFIRDFSNSKAYKKVFDASIELAEKRHVPNEKIIRSKKDGDNYFRRSTE